MRPCSADRLTGSPDVAGSNLLGKLHPQQVISGTIVVRSGEVLGELLERRHDRSLGTTRELT